MEEELSILFPRNHSRGILKNPQIFKHEKCEQICFTQKSATTTVEAKSLVPFTAESRNLKSRQTCNRTSAPLDKSTKKRKFLQHVRVLLLSFKANLQVKCSQDHQMTLGQQMESNNCIKAELSVPRCFGVRQHGRQLLHFSHAVFYL